MQAPWRPWAYDRHIILMILVFVVASVAGYLLISRVPQRLHTPLMSMTNAISGVTIIGAVLLFSSKGDAFTMTLGGVAVVMAAFNGGRLRDHQSYARDVQVQT